MVKLRFAPSPTGNLHVGNFRTALINFLFTQKYNGHFLLRIDDTDIERSRVEFEKSIKEDLSWAGLNWDSLVKQSDRLSRYKQVLESLIEKELVYPCFETPEELSLKRKSQLSSGKPPIYDRSSLKLSLKDIEGFKSQGKKPHYRFLLKHETVFWNDMVRGDSKYNMGNISDPIIVREDGRFIYTLASVIDDIDLKISHIIRGEDHVTNSAAQIQIFNSMGANVPIMGHLSLMTDIKGEGLSKRTGGLSIKDLRNEEIESLSLNSYLSLAGTSKNIILKENLKEIISDFDITNFNRAPTKFNYNDLKNLNSKYIQKLDYEELKLRFANHKFKLEKNVWDLIRANVSSLNEIQEWENIIYGKLKETKVDKSLKKEFSKYLPNGEFDDETWRNWINNLKENYDMNKGEIFKLLREALTGYKAGPEMSSLIIILGKEKVLERLNN